ncbi:acetyl-CoA synthetase [Ephemerocybe angulata]|uniref:Acetyl-CoA synthetase n=1 Tax=Ephemerocybe angulata TaxID=980116 RepID=A0A8H6MGI9_9AGAR|nr:acetyl-CoA synthetase [Tulosesus angulatus]
MAFNIAEYLVTDDLTILLGLIAATVFLVNNLYKPQPLSDVGRARNPGESAVYRNYTTGLMGRFPLRPSKDVAILADLVRPETEGPRTLWSTKISNHGFQDRVASVGTGLIRLASLKPHESTVLLLLNDCVEFLLSDLALASHSILTYTLSSSTLLTPVLESHHPTAVITHAFMLPSLLELIYDHSDVSVQHTIIVVGEPSASALSSVASNVTVLNFADVEREGTRTQKILSPVPTPSDVFTVSFYEAENGLIQGAQLTHANITAGVAALHALLPAANAFTPLDTITSAHSLSTTYGRTVAYTALYEGTSFATLATSAAYHIGDKPEVLDSKDAISGTQYPIPSPTILFVKPEHLKAIATDVIKQAARSWLLYPFAWRHKISGATEGFITKESLWDRVVFDGARTKILGPTAATLRAVIVSGGPVEASLMTPARIALSVPIVTTKSGAELPAHTGPPGVNVEVKLVGVDDEAVENEADPVGVVFVRGPPVGKLVNVDSGYVDVPAQNSEEDEGWTGLGLRAKVHTNGAFVVMTD